MKPHVLPAAAVREAGLWIRPNSGGCSTGQFPEGAEKRLSDRPGGRPTRQVRAGVGDAAFVPPRRPQITVGAGKGACPLPPAQPVRRRRGQMWAGWAAALSGLVPGPTLERAAAHWAARPPSRKRSAGLPPRLPLHFLPGPARAAAHGDWAGSIMGSVTPRSASALLLLLLLQVERPRGAELTFELPDNAKQCFHEDVEQGVKFSLDYQVRPWRPAVPPLSLASRSLVIVAPQAGQN